MNPWIAERSMPSPRNSSVDQINSIILQELFHGEATLYPALTVQGIIEIPTDLPRNS